MEKHLDNYLNVFEKKYNQDISSSNPREYIYSAADEISTMIDNVENGINEVKSRVFSAGQQHIENGNVNFSSSISKEDFNFDVKYIIKLGQ